MDSATAKSSPAWLFERMSPRTNGRSITEEAFSEKDPVRCLLNEAFQNGKDSKSKVLRFRWSDVSSAALDAVGLGEIVERIQGSPRLLDKRGSMLPMGETVRVMAVEDHGIGMGGEYRRASGVDEIPGGYQAFACGVGNSSKGRGASGSKGVGRMALLSASAVNVLLTLTVRDQDDKALFFGLANLDLHGYRGGSFRPEGQFLTPDGEGGGLPLVDDEAYAMADSLGIDRERGAHGTTILIPALREEFTKDTFLNLILREHFTAIATGLLVVELIDEMGTVVIDADTVVPLAAENVGPGHAELIGTVSRLFFAMQETDVDLGELRERLNGDAIGEANLDLLTANFQEKNPASLKVSYMARFNRQEVGERGDIRLGVIHNEALVDGALILMRDGINKVMPLRGRPYVAMAISAEDAIAEMLRAGEDASHQNWSASTMVERGYARKVANVVCPAFESGAKVLLDVLTRKIIEEDDTVYADIFAMPRPKQKQEASPGNDAGDNDKPERIEAKELVATPLVSEKIQADRDGNWGFRIRLSERGRARMTSANPYTEFQIGAVYAVSEGRRSVKKHSPADFDLTKCRIEAQGCTVAAVDVLSFVATGVTEDFSVEVIGDFNPARELEVLLMTEKGKKDSSNRKAA